MFALIGVLLFSSALTADPGRPLDDHLGGGSRTFTIRSQVLAETRKIDVHLPPSFSKTGAARSYPVIVVLDGDFLFGPVVTMSEVLVRFGQMPETVIVGVENTDDSYGDRVRDLTPPGMSVSGSSRNQKGDRFLRFIEEEVLPSVEKEFRAGKPRVLVGLSSGAILATWAAATSDTFRLVLAIDPPIHLEDAFLARKLMERAKSRESQLRYVSYEARFGWSDDRWRVLESIAPPGWRLHREHVPRETHQSMEFIATYLGLRELFSDYSSMSAPETPTTSVMPYYRKLAESYGAPLAPPRPLLNQLIEDLLIEGRGTEAHAAFKELSTNYGQPKNATELTARIADVEHRPRPSETVEALLATPFPAVEEAKAYMGDWVGEQWANDEPHHKIELHLVAEGDRVTGTLVDWPEPGMKLEQKLEYLKVTPDGLTFGFMNGMRPRGMLLHEGKLENGTLGGKVRFGGVRVVYPKGVTPPVHHFFLTKGK